MRIALNALNAQTGGGVSVLTNLLPLLADIDAKNSYFIVYSPRQSGFVEAIPEFFHKVAVNHNPRNLYLRVLWEQVVFPFYLFWHRIDVLYSVGNTTCLLAPCKIALLIENANPYSFINLQWTAKERLRNKLLRALGWLSARRATKIRFVSKNSQDLIVPQLGVPLDKSVVIPHGVSPTTPNPSSGRRGEPYLLAIGVNGPHRNTERLLKAFSILITKYKYDGNLVVVGTTWSLQWQKILDNTAQALKLRARVRFAGEVPHWDVSAYFKHADALAFPSIEETFGIPLIEAMTFGVPIAASDCDLEPAYRGRCFNPFREICRDAAQYFNPFNPEDMAQGIQRVLTDTALRGQLISHGKERVKKYDLEYTSHALVQLFGSVYTT